ADEVFGNAQTKFVGAPGIFTTSAFSCVAGALIQIRRRRCVFGARRPPAVKKSEVVARHSVVRVTGALIQHHSMAKVERHADTGPVSHAKFVARRRVSTVTRALEKSGGTHGVFLRTIATLIGLSELETFCC